MLTLRWPMKEIKIRRGQTTQEQAEEITDMCLEMNGRVNWIILGAFDPLTFRFEDESQAIEFEKWVREHYPVA